MEDDSAGDADSALKTDGAERPGFRLRPSSASFGELNSEVAVQVC